MDLDDGDANTPAKKQKSESVIEQVVWGKQEADEDLELSLVSVLPLNSDE